MTPTSAECERCEELRAKLVKAQKQREALLSVVKQSMGEVAACLILQGAERLYDYSVKGDVSAWKRDNLP